MFGGIKPYLGSPETLLDLIYPESCQSCSEPIHSRRMGTQKSKTGDLFFCQKCWGEIRRLEGPSCPVCASPCPSETALSNSPSPRCGDCREDPPFFDKAITPYRYEGPLKEAVQRLKYQQQTRLAFCLAKLLVSELTPLKVDLVMAIPLHPKRLRSREFNQSLLLAKELSRIRGWPLNIDSFRRIRETASQVGLSKKERKKNIERAFSVVRPESIKGHRILLIDDVYTTGATLKEGAKTLIKSGAKTVIAAAPTRMVLGVDRDNT